MSNRTSMTTPAAITILAIDLGKFKSVACRYDPATGEHAFQTIATTPAAVHDLLVEIAPAVLVIEACSICGWIADLAESLGIAVRVANTLDDARRRQTVQDRQAGQRVCRSRAQAVPERSDEPPRPDHRPGTGTAASRSGAGGVGAAAADGHAWPRRLRASVPRPAHAAQTGGRRPGEKDPHLVLGDPA